jgi:deoxycytidylate deaminase
MTSTTSIHSLFDDREALAHDGEIELTESRSAISDSEWRRREAKGSAKLAKHGYDTNGDLLGPVAGQDIMTQGKRVSEKRNSPRPDFVSEAALHSGAKLHAEPEAAIDAKRRHHVAMHKFYKLCTEPCDDAHRHVRIEAGLRLIADAQSDFEKIVIAGAIRRDCKILGIGTPASFAVAMGCSTSTAYERMKDGSLTSAIVAVAAEKERSIAEARQSRGLKLDIRLATKGTKFDSAAWHREIEKLYVSLKYQIIDALARETTLSRFDALKGSDRALKMLPQSRIELLAELALLTPEICRKLGKMPEADRDEWLAERDAESIAELCGDENQRRKCSSRYSSEEYARRIKAYLEANGRSADGPVLPKPNVPAPASSRKKKAA